MSDSVNWLPASLSSLSSSPSSLRRKCLSINLCLTPWLLLQKSYHSKGQYMRVRHAKLSNMNDISPTTFAFVGIGYLVGYSHLQTRYRRDMVVAGYTDPCCPLPTACYASGTERPLFIICARVRAICWLAGCAASNESRCSIVSNYETDWLCLPMVLASNVNTNHSESTRSCVIHNFPSPPRERR